MKKIVSFFLLTGCFVVPTLQAELRLPAIIGNGMVLQQKQANPIWGWDTPGTRVSVSFAGQTKSTEAGADGKWTVKLDAVPANEQPQTIEITAGTQKVRIGDVLVGEVWMCSGQSNMGFTLGGDWNGDLEAEAAKFPKMRLMKVPLLGTQELQTNFRDGKGAWTEVTPATAKGFSAVGFLFGRYIHQVVGVPVGLIDNAWGGSSAEAWVRRETLEKDPRFASLIENTLKDEAHNSTEQAQASYEVALEKHKIAAAKAKAEGRTAPRAPKGPKEWLSGQHRAGNIFAGTLHPTLGYGIKGVIWYQGESNAGRAWEYAQLFPLLIEQWRKEWNQGNFPFYWVQLADYQKQESQPGEAAWAELRESQTRTMSLPNTGQAVIIDLGEGQDIHPKNKHDVAARLVRWALAKDYGISIPYRSPEYKAVEFRDNKAIVTVDCFGSALRAFDVEEAIGFAVCGDDRVWHWAKGKVLGKDKVELTCAEVSKPVAVRYAWANNPVCNLTSNEGLPLTPFRTDDFDMTTKPKAPAAGK
jgi:sialate O-acetylesterase